MKRILVLAAILLVGAWALLFLSSRGVLIGSEIEGVWPTCTYFTGTSILKLRINFDRRDQLGRPLCPRLYDFGAEPSY